MSQLRVYQTEAIVIKRVKLGEADRILTLYTPEKGKIKAVAKGTRRPISKLGGHVELLTHSQLLIARGRNLDIITQAQTINCFMPIKNDLNRLSQGLYCAELVDVFAAERIESAETFHLLRDTLERLANSKTGAIALRYFELQLLNYLGYRPQLQSCTLCNRAIQSDINYFSSCQGGIICSQCIHEEIASRRLSLNALKVLRLWQNCDYATAIKININEELAKELEDVLRDYLKYLLEKQIKSTAFLDMLKVKLVGIDN
ncbi:MAG TPA: DNA repair protein RecO [Dehalococcoidia bacterium]|nr:DNA repair protein RecO [Dehalococcoidia bacterium]